MASKPVLDLSDHQKKQLRKELAVRVDLNSDQRAELKKTLGFEPEAIEVPANLEVSRGLKFIIPADLVCW